MPKILHSLLPKSLHFWLPFTPVSKWYDYINEPTLADAIMDRLTANAVRVELKGDSMRRKNQKK